MKSIEHIGNIKGKKILLRADFNVPMQDGKITEDFRIRKTIPTIKYLAEKGAIVIIVAHLENAAEHSLAPVAEYLRKYFPVLFVKDFMSVEGKEALGGMKNGGVALIENIRYWDGEKKNDKKFAQELASLADIYVNEAFSVSHREHASIVGVPKFIPGYAGFLFEDEVKNLSKAFNPKHPFLFILGGAKFETKLPLVKKFLKTADKIFIGGALANDVLKARGYEIGLSTSSDKKIDFRGILENEKIVLLVDCAVITPEGTEAKMVGDIGPEDKIMDAGRKLWKS